MDSNNKLTNLNKQGAQEVSEFLALPQVFKWANKQTDFIIFGGDTNIKNENYFLARKFVNKDTNIESVLDLSVNLANKRTYKEQFITSLGTRGNYTNQYDKMFFINNDKQTFTPQIIKNGLKDFKIDIYKAFSYFITKQQLKNAKGWLPKYNSQKDNQVVRSLISDHAPVFTDINLNTNIDATKVDASLKSTIFKIAKDAKTIRVAHWNILNYGKKNDKDEAKALSLASIIYKSAFDIVGLTEINNGRGEKVQLIVDELNKLIKESRFKVIVQLQKDTKIREEYLNSGRFGKGQQEQVAIIYDSKNFDLINSASFTYPIKYWA
ncbi:hypothetical protein E1I18_01295 [Mycoplasmopsis mucosicanis]|uniref:Endonuclease/exonuclease/phosphatase domain-containing protein n=1 Tax=Mycoplasmopsis mucosicanis TaxID=458208 RepID=A0A507SQ64_9BACT|nr:hypothetical protein [Mycoplasmopsis mucosicanis]TQC53950.1 hypothetical protein E1I18_01295 [Mycoplasmopsis mucosicanis]